MSVDCPWNSPGRHTGDGSHSPLKGIFATQELNSGLLHGTQILYHLSHQGSQNHMSKSQTEASQYAVT